MHFMHKRVEMRMQILWNDCAVWRCRMLQQHGRVEWIMEKHEKLTRLTTLSSCNLLFWFSSQKMPLPQATTRSIFICFLLSFKPWTSCFEMKAVGVKEDEWELIVLALEKSDYYFVFKRIKMQFQVVESSVECFSWLNT